MVGWCDVHRSFGPACFNRSKLWCQTARADAGSVGLGQDDHQVARR